MMIKSLYVHIPFCQHICAYCDFCRIGYNETLAQQYLQALEKELSGLKQTTFETVYIGGGTPSALSIPLLKQLFVILQPYTTQAVEYTMEVNPETVDEAKIATIKQGGINRVSLGVQVTQQHLLKTIFRKHQFDDVTRVVNLFCQTGITNITLDLMYGIPNQTLRDFVESMTLCTSLPIKHISLYSLTIEPNSYFGRKGIQALSDIEDEQMYFSALKYLPTKNFIHYEISNFALAGYQSKHNQSYWRYDDFIGVGASASSKVGKKRWTNTFNIQAYIKGVNDLSEVVNLTDDDQRFEYLMMNLRLKQGFLLEEFKQRFQVDFCSYYQQALQETIKKRWLIVDNQRCRASETGFTMLNDVLLYFFKSEKK